MRTLKRGDTEERMKERGQRNQHPMSQRNGYIAPFRDQVLNGRMLTYHGQDLGFQPHYEKLMLAVVNLILCVF